MNKTDKGIGQIIKKARQSLRITSRQLAEKVRLSPVVMCRIEQNLHLPTDGKLQRICEVLYLNYYELADKREIVQKELDKNGSFVMGTKLVDGHRQHFNCCRCGECGKFSEEYKLINGTRYICIDCLKKNNPNYKPVVIKENK